MRSAAEVCERAVLIICNGSVLKLADEFAFVLVALLGEVLHSLVLGHVDSLEFLFRACKFQHLLLDLRQVRVRNLVSAEIHVIIEAVLDCRTDTELDSRIERLERLGEKM